MPSISRALAAHAAAPSAPGSQVGPFFLPFPAACLPFLPPFLPFALDDLDRAPVLAMEALRVMDRCADSLRLRGSHMSTGGKDTSCMYAHVYAHVCTGAGDTSV